MICQIHFQDWPVLFQVSGKHDTCQIFIGNYEVTGPSVIDAITYGFSDSAETSVFA